MAQPLKIACIAIASAIAGAYTMHYIDSIANQADALAQSQNAAQLIEQLQQENTQLNALLEQKKIAATNVAGKATEISAPLPAQAKPDEKSATPASVTAVQDSQALHKSESFGKWLTSAYKETANFDLHKEMQRRFDAEAIDPEWAEAQERQYLTLFSQDPELAGLALRETQCRTQQCALTISISDINQANELLEKMTKTLQQSHHYPMIVAIPDEQQGVTTLYIGKEADSFEFN